MQNTFGALDNFKLAALLEEAIQKLQFLSAIQKEDEASSELAGYEINKLLSEQSKLESRYAKLLKDRGTLTGITNKRKLDVVQKEILEVASSLKESTKKLCRLFRENPDFASDAAKIGKERAELREQFELLMQNLQTETSFSNFQNNVIKELENQDELRKLILTEKQLTQDIKNLTSQWKNEYQEYQNEQNEKQKNIQKYKEKLVKAKTRSDIETKYHEKEVKAEEGMKSRLQNHRIEEFRNEISFYEKKKEIENQVFQQISAFLRAKEAETSAKADEWQRTSENMDTKMDNDIQKLKYERDKVLQELEELKRRLEIEDHEKREKERKQKEIEDAKRRKLEEEEKLDNAVRMIQEYYKAFTANGGTLAKKKKKGGMGKK